MNDPDDDDFGFANLVVDDVLLNSKGTTTNEQIIPCSTYAGARRHVPESSR